MSSLKLGQIEVAPKDFYKQRQVADMLTVNINKVLLSEVSCNDGKG